MRAGRVAALLFFLFVFLFFPIYGLQWLCLFSLLVLLLSFSYTWIVSLSLTVRRRDLWLRTYRLQPADMEIEVVNRGFLPVHYMTIVDAPGNLYTNGGERIVVSLRPFERRIIRYRVQGDARGEYLIGPLRVRWSDPAGFFPKEILIEDTAHLIVYPNVYPIRLLIESGLPAGNLRTPNPIYEDITRFRSLREYIPGDEPRRIQWKVTARLGKLHSMEFLPSLYFPALILLNLSLENYPLKHRFQAIERAIETAASLVFSCVERKQDVGLVSSGTLGNGDHPVAGIRGGHPHAVSILESLARVSGAGGSDCTVLLFSSGIRIPPGCRIMYIGPFPENDQMDRLVSVSGGSVVLELYLISHGTRETGVPSNMNIHLVRDYGEDLIENG